MEAAAESTGPGSWKDKIEDGAGLHERTPKGYPASIDVGITSRSFVAARENDERAVPVCRSAQRAGILAGHLVGGDRRAVARAHVRDGSLAALPAVGHANGH